MTIEDHRLRAFCLVVELKSFSRAAAVKFMTQSAMSHLIRSLEQDLDEKLLVRGTRTVMPTPAGKVLYAHAQEILRQYQNINEDMCALTAKMRGTLQVISTRIIAQNLLPEVLYSFNRSHQDVVVNISLGKTEQVIKTLADGSADVGFFEGSVKEIPSHAEKISTDEIALIASDSHPLACRKSITPNQLAEQIFLMPEAGSGIREYADTYLRSLGAPPEKLRIVMTIGDPHLLVKMVQSGAGIAFVSRCAAAQSLQNGSVVRLPVSRKRLVRNLYMIVNPDTSLPARSFSKFVREFRFFATS